MLLMQEDNEDIEKGSVSKGKEGKEPPNEDIEADLQVSASAFEALERDFQEVRIFLLRRLCSSLSHFADSSRRCWVT
jgi:hypothetical protein